MIVTKEQLISAEFIRNVISGCIIEDGGFGNDVTTNSIKHGNRIDEFAINIRGRGTVAGLELIAGEVDMFGKLEMELLCKDGDTVQDANIAIVKGPVQDILFAERTILNILGHASGIATHTKLFVDAVAGTSCNICDTRKTTPGLRLLDKYAVLCGGGTSHRFGLHDAALFKDNHLAGFTNLETVSSISQTGVDRISIGSLIHQAPWIDVGLDFYYA
jgi:nicotinate-nucleotide pyrophosphorylase (carboxylating)